jgi:hypothetical protein
MVSDYLFAIAEAGKNKTHGASKSGTSKTGTAKDEKYKAITEEYWKGVKKVTEEGTSDAALNECIAKIVDIHWLVNDLIGPKSSELQKEALKAVICYLRSKLKNNDINSRIRQYELSNSMKVRSKGPMVVVIGILTDKDNPDNKFKFQIVLRKGSNKLVELEVEGMPLIRLVKAKLSKGGKTDKRRLAILNATTEELEQQ